MLITFQAAAGLNRENVQGSELSGSDRTIRLPGDSSEIIDTGWARIASALCLDRDYLRSEVQGINLKKASGQHITDPGDDLNDFAGL